jgi:hypothetical protein
MADRDDNNKMKKTNAGAAYGDFTTCTRNHDDDLPIEVSRSLPLAGFQKGRAVLARARDGCFQNGDKEYLLPQQRCKLETTWQGHSNSLVKPQ